MDPKQTLRFTKIYLKNWRNFAEVVVVLPRRAFLVGPNASGKTNFLDAFRFLSQIASSDEGGLRKAIKDRVGIMSLRRMSAARKQPIDIRVEIGNDENAQAWGYELVFSQLEDQSGFIINREAILRNGKVLLEKDIFSSGQDGEAELMLKQTLVVSFTDGTHEGSPGTPTPLKNLTTRIYNPGEQTLLETERWQEFFPDLVDFFRSVRHFNVVPALIRHPDLKSSSENGYNDYIEQIASSPEEEQSSRIKQIQEVLRGAVPQFKDLRVARGTFDVPHLYARYAGWKGKNAWENESKFSDGTLRLIGLLWAMQDGAGPILIEEPELSLHPGVVRFIPDMLLRAGYQSGRQTLVSTHSSTLVDNDSVELSDVIILIPEQQGTSLRLASSFEEVRSLVENGYVLSDVLQALTSPRGSDELALVEFSGSGSGKAKGD